mmetsp:Transcript_21398/g.25772  ORF Transcript_21398/g.25772 Transcript_21398/m.25772 type:complete len:92 (+) Transcript_21398:103-378(+)|eukprot:CAMPEP_0197863892 /NCGR_PEP_ID=MMETSP1438-20131217/41686_1 /TAXON_ID=1461541 /ORGANISM="Pterosperma sp., Strain CCMP1384" /LENGTH=91 /DNA_ID=CAMNT_0043481947 /DNA_START=96 /DNA_END=371 /DNA_ORIENTATION=-
MPGIAFDGSVWVTGGQAATVAFGGVLGAVGMASLLKRAVAKEAEAQVQYMKESRTAPPPSRRRKIQAAPQKPVPEEPASSSTSTEAPSTDE